MQSQEHPQCLLEGIRVVSEAGERVQRGLRTVLFPRQQFAHVDVGSHCRGGSLDRPLTRSRDDDIVAEAFGKYMRSCERQRRVNLADQLKRRATASPIRSGSATSNPFAVRLQASANAL